MRIRTLVFTSIIVAALGTASLATSAHAATPSKTAEPNRHCVINVSNDALSCYDSFTEAIAKATGGRITDAPDNAREAMKDPRLAAQLNAPTATKGSSVAAAADVVIGVEWEDSDFEGDSLTFHAPSGCTGTTSDIDWVKAVLPADWNDEIGSYKGTQGFANCWVKHFEHIHFSGISTAFDNGQSDMGWMDDETSSIQWS